MPCRDLQPLPSPDPFDRFEVHDPAGVSPRTGDREGQRVRLAVPATNVASLIVPAAKLKHRTSSNPLPHRRQENDVHDRDHVDHSSNSIVRWDFRHRPEAGVRFSVSTHRGMASRPSMEWPERHHLPVGQAGRGMRPSGRGPGQATGVDFPGYGVSRPGRDEPRREHPAGEQAWGQHELAEFFAGIEARSRQDSKSSGWIFRFRSRIVSAWLRWHRERQIARAILDVGQLDDRLLRDIGIQGSGQIEPLVRFGRDSGWPCKISALEGDRDMT